MSSPTRPLNDFRSALYLIWKHLNLPAPSPLQNDIAGWLQNSPRRIVLMAFRGIGKSWITAAYVVWLLYMDPQRKILVVSASKDRSDSFSIFVKRLIHEIPEFQFLKPRTSQGQRDSNISFDVGPSTADQSPSVKSVGILGQLAGSRATHIIADDIEVPNNSATEQQREKIAERVKEFDAVLKPGGKIIYLGTPQTESSLYNKLPQRGYTPRIWPARYPKPDVLSKYRDRLSPAILATLDAYGEEQLQNEGLSSCGGAPVDPERFDDEDLLEREASYGRSGFMLQFMLSTALSDAERYPLKVADLVVIPRMSHHEGFEKVVWASDPRLTLHDLPNVSLDGDRFYSPMETSGGGTPFTGSVMAIDPSGRGKDETGYCVSKFLNGYVCVTKAGGRRGGYEEKDLEALAEIAKDQKVNKIIVESNWGGSKSDSMFIQLFKVVLQRIYPVTVEAIYSSGQKENRIIEALEPIMNRHRLVLDSRIIEDDYRSVQDLPAEQSLKYQLVYQMSRITRDRRSLRHDDRLEALSMAVGYWTQKMDADEDRMIQARHSRALKNEVGALKRAARIGAAVMMGRPSFRNNNNRKWASRRG